MQHGVFSPVQARKAPPSMDYFPYYTMEGGKKSIGPGLFFKKRGIARLCMAFSLDNFGRSFAAFAPFTAGLFAGGTSRRDQTGFFFMPIEFPCHHSHIVAWAPYTAQPRVCRKRSVFVFFGPENQQHVMDDTSKTVFQKDFHKAVQRHGTSARGCRTKRTEHRIHRGRRPSGLSAPA